MEIPSEPKKSDPLDPLPKGTFDLEDWKRFYSNNDEDKSCEYFWSKFDPSCYSIWRGDYRYNNELSMIFMSCNLMGGMFQRLEKLKKNAFASAMLFGENDNSSISAIWVFKGQELAFELNEDWQVDYSSYEWKKMDPSTTETKAMVEQYWKWEGQDKEGRKFNQDLAFELNEDWQVDYSSYEWKKMDPSTTETKTMVEQYWNWEGQDKEGRKFNQGK